MRAACLQAERARAHAKAHPGAPGAIKSLRLADAILAEARARLPVQAVGGLSVEQAVRTPEYGAPLVVLGAPLTIDADAFKTASGDLESKLRLICERVHAYGDVGPREKS